MWTHFTIWALCFGGLKKICMDSSWKQLNNCGRYLKLLLRKNLLSRCGIHGPQFQWSAPPGRQSSWVGLTQIDLSWVNLYLAKRERSRNIICLMTFWRAILSRVLSCFLGMYCSAIPWSIQSCFTALHWLKGRVFNNDQILLTGSESLCKEPSLVEQEDLHGGGYLSDFICKAETFKWTILNGK